MLLSCRMQGQQPERTLKLLAQHVACQRACSAFSAPPYAALLTGAEADLEPDDELLAQLNMDAYDDEDAEDNTARIFGSGNPGMTFYTSNVQVRLLRPVRAAGTILAFFALLCAARSMTFLQKPCAGEAQPALHSSHQCWSLPFQCSCLCAALGMILYRILYRNNVAADSLMSRLSWLHAAL